MSSVDFQKKLRDLRTPGERSGYQTKRRNHQNYPDGWRPRLDVDSEAGGYIIPVPYEMGSEPDNEQVLQEFGYNPAEWEVVSVRHGKWQTYDERWLESKRINIRPRAMEIALQADADAILKRISKWKPRKPPQRLAEASFFALTGDAQVGKAENGGTEALLELYFRELDRTVERQKRFRAETVVLPWLGDCVEGNQSQDGKVRGRVDLSITEQIRVLRRLIMAEVKAFAPTADRLVVPVVPGNHDEPDRRLLSEHDDSWAVEAMSAVFDAVDENPELRERVKFLFPDSDSLSITDEFNNLVFSMVHGHQFGSGYNGWEKWWEGQCAGRTPIGDADVLLSAHRHHLRIEDFGGSRIWIQQPALDVGSNWYTQRKGQQSPSRLVSFLAVEGRIAEFDPLL